MRYYSTNHNSAPVSLSEAVVKGLAADRGLFMPERIERLPQEFFDHIQDMTFQDIAYRVAQAFFGEDIDEASLRRIVDETLSFDCPLVKVEDGIYSLELFHGPTLAFKDVGARFMARMLSHFNRSNPGEMVNVLVATSGDTGSAVANGFLGVEGIHVYVLYPKGKVSKIQECQFTTLGQNITAVEVDGTFDDCQALVKNAFMDAELNAHMRLTSANSINVARFLPQAFYYFWAYAQLKKAINTDPSSNPSSTGFQPVYQPTDPSSNPSSTDLQPVYPDLVVAVPSGNFGNITAALFGHAMGLPIKRFIAANNANDIFYQYLMTGLYQPKPSKQTIANAMDVGDPSNFARVMALYDGDHARVTGLISGATYTDNDIRQTMRQCYKANGYVLDPHGACGYRALKEGLHDGEVGVFCETAHPAKFKDTVESAIGAEIPLPDKLAAFMRGEKRSVAMPRDFAAFKQFLMAR